MNICVYGASSALLKNIYYEKTEELGRAMGKRGHGLVFGGATRNDGAAARGVAAEKMVTYLELLPDFDQPGVLYEKCTEFIFHREYERAQKTSGRKIRCYDRSTCAELVLTRNFFEIFTLKSLETYWTAQLCCITLTDIMTR